MKRIHNPLNTRMEDLHCLLEVSRTRSVTAAAESVGMTQSAVSHTLSRMEKTFGVKLLRRGKNGMEFTSAGMLLAQQAQQILDEFEQMLQMAVSEENHAVRVGICRLYEKYLASHLVDILASRFPGANVSYTTGYCAELMSTVAKNQLDFCVVPHPLRKKALRSVKLFSDTALLAISTPIANQNGPAEPVISSAALAVLTAQPLLVPRKESRFFSIFQQFADKANIKPERMIEADSFDTLWAYVENGIGIAFIPATVCRSMPAGKAIARRIDGLDTSYTMDAVFCDDLLEKTGIPPFLEGLHNVLTGDYSP